MNSNCLAGMRCQCGSEGPFRIAVTAVATIGDEGSEEVTELDWSDASRFSCVACGRSGVVGELRGRVMGEVRAVELRDLVIPEDAWEDWSGEEEPAGVVLGTHITLNGTHMHVEAIEVVDDESGEQVARDGLREEQRSRYHEAAGADGRMDTVTIGNRNYAVFCSPFC